MYAIFNGVDANQIRLIASCETIKQAWNILQTTNKGTSDIKRSRLLILITRFEELHMSDNESFVDFYAKLYDIVNELFALNEKIPESKLVWKVDLFLTGFNPKSQPSNRAKIWIP